MDTSHKPMKIPAIYFFAAASLVTIASTASAATLFTDNFDVTMGSFIPPSNAGLGPNSEAANPGRQGGTLATPILAYTFSGNAQVGNTTTLAANANAGSAVGDDMLLANGASATIGYNFAAIAGPLTVTFDGLPNAQADLTNWISFMVSENAGTQFVNNGTVDFGILFRANGLTQYFVDGDPGTIGGAGTSVGQNTWANYKIVLSDAVGTGSAFGSGSSRVDYFQNGTLLGTVNVTDPCTSTQGFIAFGAGALGGIDNIVVTSVPEPSSMMAALSGLTGLMLVRCRK